MATSVVVCVDPFTAEFDGAPIVVKGGQRFKSNHPLVKRHPELFANDGDLEEFERKRRALYAPALAQRPMDTPAARILTPKYRAKRKVRLEVDGELREVKKGDLVPLDDPIAVVAPDGFEKVSVES